MIHKIVIILWCGLLFLRVPLAWSEPKNIILLIGDGMGFEHVRAAGMYENGTEGSLLFETFPYQAEVTTYSADSPITDSAAAATAIATGTKVNNGVISVALPGDGSPLSTLLEYFRDNGKRTGLVTTTSMTHATPAAFGAHEPNRNNTAQIADDLLVRSLTNVLFGSGGSGMTVAAAESANYDVVTDRSSMQLLDPETVSKVSGQFGSSDLPFEYDYFTGIENAYDSLPHLSEMTTSALAILANDPDGFILMVEGGQIDWAAHDNNIQQTVFETIEFNNTVQTVLDWARGQKNTLILVAADHETGGLTVVQNNGQGVFPTVSWTTLGHTSADVPIYATGENAQMISGVMDNIDIFSVISSTTFDSVDYYCDADNDGYISSSVSGNCTGIGCEPIDCKTVIGNDCDDADGIEHPGQVWYEDIDGDLYSSGNIIIQCERPADYCVSAELSSTSGDCNDADYAVNPGAEEICDTIDNNCNGQIDENTCLSFPDIIAPVPGSTLSGSTETFSWTANGTAVNEWWLWIGTTQGGQEILNSGSLGSSTSSTITGLPVNGSTVYVRLHYTSSSWSVDWNWVDFEFTAYTAAPGELPEILSPVPGSTLSGLTETFTWTANASAVNEWWLWIGTTQGGQEILNSGSLGSSTSSTITGLPVNGSTVYVRLHYTSSSWGVDWNWVDFEFTAYTAAPGELPEILSPVPGSTLSASSETFTWSDNGTPVNEWWLWVGPCSSSAWGGCGDDIYNSGSLGSSTSTTINGLPTDGSTVYVRLWYNSGGWKSVLFQYTGSL